MYEITNNAIDEYWQFKIATQSSPILNLSHNTSQLPVYSTVGRNDDTKTLLEIPTIYIWGEANIFWNDKVDITKGRIYKDWISTYSYKNVNNAPLEYKSFQGSKHFNIPTISKYPSNNTTYIQYQEKEPFILNKDKIFNLWFPKYNLYKSLYGVYIIDIKTNIETQVSTIHSTNKIVNGSEVHVVENIQIIIKLL